MESVVAGPAGLLGKGLMVGLVGSLAMIIASWEKTDRLRDRYRDINRDYGDIFDFIVVGAGTAGSLVANRLSKSYKVLLLESGGEPHPFQAVPLLANFMAGYEQVDWMHVTSPQKNALFGSPDNRGRISGGKGLGGTSNLDHLMHLRGNPRDYDNWARVTNDSSWSYANLVEYFNKFEKYEGFWKGKQEGMHGEEGEMRLAPPTHSMLAKRFVVAGNEMGFPHVDLNGYYQQGFDVMTQPLSRGHRQTAYDAFLRRGQHRWNLVTKKYATVHKILIRGDLQEAYGVEYERHGKVRHAYAKKEVILSAGAMGSPKLLMLSGIGGSGELQRLGIPARIHLPGVGKNLQDHLGVPLGPFLIRGTTGMSILVERDVGPAAFLSLMSRGKGPLTTSGYEAAAMLTSDGEKIRGGAGWPDIQLTLHSLGLDSTADIDISHAHRLKRSMLAEYFEGSKGKDSFTIIVSGTRPRSRGEVRLRDANPTSPVVVDPQYLGEVDDVRVLVDGVKKAMRLVENTVQFQEIGATFTNMRVGGCEHYRPKSDEYWACYLRVMCYSMGDVVGTAALGSVVDNDLFVMGTRRLRVVDASVMPSLVSGGTSPATLAIAEKASAMILGLWGSPDKKTRLLNESKQVGSILRGSADKIRALNSGYIFLRHMQNSPSYRDMEINMSPIQGYNNPFHLISPLLKATLFNTSTSQEEYIPQTTVFPLPRLPSTTSTTTPLPPPPMASLFNSQDDDESLADTGTTPLRPSHSHSLSFPVTPPPPPPPLPYFLIPKTTPHPYPLPQSFAASVDSLLYHNHVNLPYQHSARYPFTLQQPTTIRFSKTLPILGFAKVGDPTDFNVYSEPSTTRSLIPDVRPIRAKVANDTTTTTTENPIWEPLSLVSNNDAQFPPNFAQQYLPVIQQSIQQSIQQLLGNKSSTPSSPSESSQHAFKNDLSANVNELLVGAGINKWELNTPVPQRQHQRQRHEDKPLALRPPPPTLTTPTTTTSYKPSLFSSALIKMMEEQKWREENERNNHDATIRKNIANVPSTPFNNLRLIQGRPAEKESLSFSFKIVNHSKRQ